MDNKRLIIGVYILFIACFVIAWIFSASNFQSAFAGMQASSNSTAIPDSGALELFIHNASSGIMVYLASVFFAIPAVVMIAYDGVNMGLIGPLFNTILPNGGMFFIIYLIPHGIFEITASVIQSACGILLFLFIFRFVKALLGSETSGMSGAFEKTKKPLIQSLVLLGFSIVLMLIAAPIEAYFSVPFAEFIMGV